MLRHQAQSSPSSDFLSTVPTWPFDIKPACSGGWSGVIATWPSKPSSSSSKRLVDPETSGRAGAQDRIAAPTLLFTDATLFPPWLFSARSSAWGTALPPTPSDPKFASCGEPSAAKSDVDASARKADARLCTEWRVWMGWVVRLEEFSVCEEGV